jgi:hypothetical protein
VDNDPTEFLNTAVERFDPRGCTLELLGGSDVEHQLIISPTSETPWYTYVSIDDTDHFGGRYILGKELGMSRLHSAVPTDKDCRSASLYWKARSA